MGPAFVMMSYTGNVAVDNERAHLDAHQDAMPLGASSDCSGIGAAGCGLVLPWLINRAQGRRAGRASTIVSALDGDAARCVTQTTDANAGWKGP